MIYLTEYDSTPIGTITLASDGELLVGLWLAGQKHFLSGICAPWEKCDGLALFDRCKDWLDSYFAGENPDPSSIPMDPRGTDFQKRVWQALSAIPYGATATYGEIARRVGCESPRAVGGAVGRNPISILIPCHRVMGKDGAITGYAGGVEKKAFLLALEQQEKHPIRS